MEHPQEFLVSDRFYHRRTNGSVEIHVAQPQLMPPSKDGELSAYWECKYVLIHDGVATAGACGGDTWMQSFLLAYGRITTIIEPLDVEWLSSSGEQAWLVIPRLVPISWNYEFYANVVRFIKHQDDEMNALMEGRRGSRPGPNPE